MVIIDNDNIVKAYTRSKPLSYSFTKFSGEDRILQNGLRNGSFSIFVKAFSVHLFVFIAWSWITRITQKSSKFIYLCRKFWVWNDLQHFFLQIFFVRLCYSGWKLELWKFSAIEYWFLVNAVNQKLFLPILIGRFGKLESNNELLVFWLQKKRYKDFWKKPKCSR